MNHYLVNGTGCAQSFVTMNAQIGSGFPFGRSAEGQTFSETTPACLSAPDLRFDGFRIFFIPGRTILFHPIHGVLIGLWPV